MLGQFRLRPQLGILVVRCRLRREWIIWAAVASVLAAAPEPSAALQNKEPPRERIDAGARERLFSSHGIVAAQRDNAQFATRGGEVSQAVDTDTVAAR